MQFKVELVSLGGVTYAGDKVTSNDIVEHEWTCSHWGFEGNNLVLHGIGGNVKRTLIKPIPVGYEVRIEKTH